MAAVLTADDLRAVVVCFRDLLRSHQERINRLNVYPVPDGDTGTNMALTMESVVRDLADVPLGDMATTCHAIGRGALMGGRGNSGVILSQVLRAMTGRCASGGAEADGRVVAEAMVAASASAYEAVNRPVEGTILTVLREASEAASAAAGSGADLVGVLDAARLAGGEALDRTPDLLPVLKEAGVVDAGGAGFLLLLDAALHVLDDRALPDVPELATVAAPLATASGGEGHDVSDLRFEVMYLLEADDATIPVFKQVWAGIGDSIVVVGGDGLWNCHIHTDDIGAAVEAALDAGRPRNIRVTDLLEEVEEERWVREAAVEDAPPVAAVACAVVAVAAGDGVRRILHSFGVHHVVAGGQTMNPSVADLLEAVEGVPADDVVVLPNNKNIIPVAMQLDDLSTKRVRVVPTRSIAEGFAALVAYDPDADGGANHADMQRAAESVVAGEVTRAVRDTTADGVAITAGDWLGLARDGIKVVAASLPDVVTGLLGALVNDDHELVTLIEGDGSSAADTRHVTEWLAQHHPDLAVEVHHGGQPLYPYLLGIE